MIPKIIHQIWFQDDTSSFLNIKKIKNQTIHERKDIIRKANIPDELKTYQKSWVLKNPSFKYVLWNKRGIETIIKNDEKLFKTYNSLEYMIQKIDFAKYFIIKNYGGIYIDMVTDCIKSISKLYAEIADNGAVFSITPDLFYLEKIIAKKLSKLENTKIFVNNGIFAGKPNHPVWDDIFDKIKERIDEDDNPVPEFLPRHFQAIKVFNTTGPAMLTSVIDVTEHKDVAVINKKYLDPCYGFDYTCSPGRDSYAMHHHKSYWIIPEFCKKKDECNKIVELVGKTYFFVRNWFVLLVFVFFLVVGILLFYLV